MPSKLNFVDQVCNYMQSVSDDKAITCDKTSKTIYVAVCIERNSHLTEIHI